MFFVSVDKWSFEIKPAQCPWISNFLLFKIFIFGYIIKNFCFFDSNVLLGMAENNIDDGISFLNICFNLLQSSR